MDQELKQYLIDMEARIGDRMPAMETRIGDRMSAMETRIGEHIDEAMGTMQTELLRGMSAFSDSNTLRLRKIEADHSNLDSALSGRVEVLERRLLEIEKRLPPPQMKPNGGK